MSFRGGFLVADLNVKGELQLQADYEFEKLEQIPGAAGLIACFAAELRRNVDEFEIPLSQAQSVMGLRWRASAPTSGIATVRCDGQLASLSLLACGIHPETDHITLEAFQRHLLREFRDTGYEPAFDLMDIRKRPMVATINFLSPSEPADQLVTALADRCFAAAYFRLAGLA